MTLTPWNITDNHTQRPAKYLDSPVSEEIKQFSKFLPLPRIWTKHTLELLTEVPTQRAHTKS